MSTHQVTVEKHFVPTRGQKFMATIEEAFGKLFNNQARILESRTTRTGVAAGPGGPVAPPASFFKTQPPSIGRSDGIPFKTKDGKDLRKVTSSASTNTAVSMSGGAAPGESKHVHGIETGLGGGHHGGMDGAHGRGHQSARQKIAGK